MIWTYLLIAILMSLQMTTPASLAAAAENGERTGKAYMNARFGFSVQYPENWRLGNPLPDGIEPEQAGACRGDARSTPTAPHPSRRPEDARAGSASRCNTCVYSSRSILPWITAFSGVLVGIGHRPAATRICRRTCSFLSAHSSSDAGGLNGK